MADNSIDPKWRVEIILRSIAGNFTTAADAMKAGDEDKMKNWLRCGVQCLEPLERAIEMLHPKTDTIIKKIETDTAN